MKKILIVLLFSSLLISNPLELKKIADIDHENGVANLDHFFSNSGKINAYPYLKKGAEQLINAFQLYRKLFKDYNDQEYANKLDEIKTIINFYKNSFNDEDWAVVNNQIFE